MLQLILIIYLRLSWKQKFSTRSLFMYLFIFLFSLAAVLSFLQKYVS